MTVGLIVVLVVLVAAKLRVLPAARVPTNPAASRSATRSMVRCPSRRRRTSIGATHVAVWCDELARAVSAGATLVGAVRQVDPPIECAAAVGSIRLALERGAALHDACAMESDSLDLQLALTVLRASASQGGPAAEPLSRTAATLRGRAADAADRHTQSAQARLSAAVMTVLPAGMLTVLIGTSGAVRSFVASPTGLAIVAIGATLNTMGWRWMKHLIDGSRR